MTQHILEWLPAYHDGELSPSRQQQVEKHLLDCPSCSAELRTLEGLSALLKADPLPAHTPPERFAAQVHLRLPHSAASRPASQRLPGWVLGAPLALLLVWAFLQAALWITSFLVTADWLLGSTPLSAWLAMDGLPNLLGTLTILNFFLLAGAAGLWVAWLALWWVWNQNMSITTHRLEKEY